MDIGHDVIYTLTQLMLLFSPSPSSWFVIYEIEMCNMCKSDRRAIGCADKFSSQAEAVEDYSLPHRRERLNCQGLELFYNV